MRVNSEELDFAMFVKAVGNGLISDKNEKQLFQLPDKMIASNLEELINFCFGKNNFNNILNNIELINQNAILCPINTGVDEINNIILNQLSGEIIELRGIDSVIKQAAIDDLSVHNADNNMENINRQTPSGMPLII